MKYQVILIKMSNDLKQYEDCCVAYEGENYSIAKATEYRCNAATGRWKGFDFTFAELREV